MEHVRAVVEIVRGDDIVELGAITCPIRPDLDVVDDLLRLHLLVGRLGWRVRVSDVCPALAEMAGFVGVTDRLEVQGTQRPQASQGAPKLDRR